MAEAQDSADGGAMEKLHEEERAVDEEGTSVDKQVSDIKDGMESQVQKNEEFNEEAADEVEKVERSEEEKAEVEHNDVENAGEVADAQAGAVLAATRQQGQSKTEDAERHLLTLMAMFFLTRS